MANSKTNNTEDKVNNPELALTKIAANNKTQVRKLGKNKESPLSRLIISAYRISFLRRLSLALALRVEGGQMHSTTLRRLLRSFHRVTVGRYSYGACLIPGLLPPGTSVGNYCSVAEGLRVFRRNHPINHLSQHPFFYNADLGLLDKDAIEQVHDNPLTIGHDVWIGAGVTILPGCRNIGNGAIIGACSVVTKDILPYSIVAGNPAHHIGERFNSEMSAQIERTQWWTLSLTELGAASKLLEVPLTKDSFKIFISFMESSDASGN